MTTLLPVIVLVASLRRNVIVLATSYGSVGPRGELNSETPSELFSSFAFKAKGVSTSAAITEFIRIFLFASSAAIHLTNASTAAFDTQYSVLAL